MNDLKEKIEKRLNTLRESLGKLQNNANAHIGAIQELERLLKEMEEPHGVPAGKASGSDDGKLPENPKAS